MKKTLTFILFFLIGTAAFASGIQPMDALKGPIDRVIGVLKDPQYQAADQKSRQRDKMWEIVQGVFDFQEISRRTLANNWKLLSPGQQKEFVDVFSEFLGNTYLDKIQGEYKNEKVLYLGQDTLSETKVLIRTKILRENNVEVPVDYSMLLRDQGWKIYDVNIEGVSLVQNYRSQFSQILMKETPAQLIERLKKKREEQKKI
ncbi:MAG: ABC transporter substrate-binding protein [Thermodesulfobacteriota bacterium]